MSNDRRGSALRRHANGLVMRGGETQESKMWAQIGKVLCVWLIYKYAEALINHWEVLLVLISWLIAPDIAKKAITMRFAGAGVGSGYTERTERTERAVTTTTAPTTQKPDAEQPRSGE